MGQFRLFRQLTECPDTPRLKPLLLMVASLERPPRILYITYTVPWNPRYGGAMRCLGIIEGLAKRSELHVAFAGDNPADIEAFLSWTAPECISRYALTQDTSWDGIDDWQASRSFRATRGKGKYYQAFTELVDILQPDLIWYFEVEALRRTGAANLKSAVLDHCDVRWRKMLRSARQASGLHRIVSIAKAGVLRFDDVILSLRFRQSLVASPEEVGALLPARSITVLPNGFSYPERLPSRREPSLRLLFYGSLFYKPNSDGVRWMCRDVWPLVKARCADAQLDIVGLGGENLSDLAGIPGVTLYGFVGDLDAMIRQSAAMILPIQWGGGTRIKILEAWAKGLPVISTSAGAEGFLDQTDKSMLIGDTPVEFADNCLLLLENLMRGQQLAEAGHEYGRRNFDWPSVHSVLYEVLYELARS